MRITIIAGLSPFLAPLIAAAQVVDICDTAREVAACSVELEVERSDLLLISSSPRCSLVEWSVDGEQRTTLIVDKGARISDLSPAPDPGNIEGRVDVEQCVEVVDTRVDPVCYAQRARIDRLLTQWRDNSGRPVRRGRLQRQMREVVVRMPLRCLRDFEITPLYEPWRAIEE